MMKAAGAAFIKPCNEPLWIRLEPEVDPFFSLASPDILLVKMARIVTQNNVIAVESDRNRFLQSRIETSPDASQLAVLKAVLMVVERSPPVHECVCAIIQINAAATPNPLSFQSSADPLS